jgi:hypothetical protein
MSRLLPRAAQGLSLAETSPSSVSSPRSPRGLPTDAWEHALETLLQTRETYEGVVVGTPRSVDSNA